VEVTGEAASSAQVLERVGLTPLPPYILAARRALGIRSDEADDRDRYQTVYSHADQAASVAAPTAGLHFTPGLLSALDRAGIARAEVVLHVGSGTFKPVETEFVEQHPMHAEWCCMPAETRAAILETRRQGGRIIPVGTTACRTIEAYAIETEAGRNPDALTTRLLLAPGSTLHWSDGLLTNFHLPRSTLMALAATFLEPSGVERLKAAYRRAMELGFRFYSFGDAMLILPD
jgi:S-adenosylmethionine:tRNA ribosyltransferase-isomerase